MFNRELLILYSSNMEQKEKKMFAVFIAVVVCVAVVVGVSVYYGTRPSDSQSSNVSKVISVYQIAFHIKS